MLPKLLKCFSSLSLFILCPNILLTMGDDFHRTPPMGWSSWNTFFGGMNEDKVVGIADSIKRLKLDTFGYKYITIDDFWNLPDRHPETQRMQVNLERFPKGMEFIGQYLHGLGLKFGIYSDAGYKTCGGMAGSFGKQERQE